MFSPDYARFNIENGHVISGERMLKKLEAIPFPDFKGKTVLDVGCDYGQFSFIAAERGAGVLGLDRNRVVKGVGKTDLIALNNKTAQDNKFNCSFDHLDLGKQWHNYGKFDYIFVMSVYHHIYENCGDHNAIWFWLWNHCKECVIWEGPLDDSDQVVQMNVSKKYDKESILKAASIYFDVEYIGPALHEPHRYVYKFYPKTGLRDQYCVALQDGAKGASVAFQYENNRRSEEIRHILGYSPYHGSLNCLTHKPFNWDFHYYPATLLDVKERSKGINSEWSLRKARFYPIQISGEMAHVFRFENESYPSNFVEIIAPTRLRDLEIWDFQTC